MHLSPHNTRDEYANGRADDTGPVARSDSETCHCEVSRQPLFLLYATSSWDNSRDRPAWSGASVFSHRPLSLSLEHPNRCFRQKSLRHSQVAAGARAGRIPMSGSVKYSSCRDTKSRCTVTLFTAPTPTPTVLVSRLRCALSLAVLDGNQSSLSICVYTKKTTRETRPEPKTGDAIGRAGDHPLISDRDQRPPVSDTACTLGQTNL